jgi:hypothetical protein
MNSRSFGYAGITMLVALTLVLTVSPTNTEILNPSYSQPTFGTPTNPGSSSPDITGTPDTSDTGSSAQTGAAEDGEKFQQFMECLFGGDASEEDISSALDGSGDSTPTEQEIRDCFAPLYNTGGATDSTTADDSSLTDETEDADADEGESNTNDGASSEDEDESEE